MGTVKISKIGESEGCEEEDGTPTMVRVSPSLGRRGFCKVGWLMIGLSVLLLVQHTSAAALPTPTPSNPNLGTIIDIPSEIMMPKRHKIAKMNRTAKRIEETQHTYDHLHKNAYDMDFYTKTRTVMKRSEKTMEEFRRYIDENCRDIENIDTFFSWEQDTFASQLRASILKRDEQLKLPGLKSHQLRSLIALETEDPKSLKSKCKKPIIWFDDRKIKLLEKNNDLENEVVNTVFAIMYKKKGILAENHVPVPMNRTRKGSRRRRSLVIDDNDLDEAFAKELMRVLRR